MAACSSSSSPLMKYDVFLSFRGSDTRKSLVSFLFQALDRNHIETFIDYNLERGEEIAPSLLEKISQSHVSVVVFSENYAGSEWCLEELAKIRYCMDQAGQLVLPVFYDVDPAEVRCLTGKYGEAVARHATRFGEDDHPEVVEGWRRALRDISSMDGLSFQDSESEAKLVDEIVNDILRKLELIPSSDFRDGFVGMEARINQVESLLSHSNVLSVGIFGMGGIGKTALAEALFHRIVYGFDGCCFVNVREELEKCSLAVLKSKILSAVLREPGLSVGTPSSIPMSVRRRLRMKRVIIALDDVTSHQRLEILAGHRSMYCSGSKIIVTSRNKQVLQRWCDRTFEVGKLNFRHGFQLFRWHAFSNDRPREEILELSQRVVKFIDGIPLSLKVLGSNLYGRSLEDWESTLVKLERIPDKEIMQILQISFDGLERHEKQIFLDVACFFRGAEKNHVERVLDACDFHASHGIRSLIDKCLVTVSNKKLRMHDLLQQMGQDIVRRECINDPGKRSRLWDHKEICNVMLRNKGTEKIEGISLDLLKSGELALSSATFSRMHNLRLLKFYNLIPSKLKLSLPSGLDFLPDELRLLSWCQYPQESLPLGFSPENLVELHMPDSQVKQLWKTDQSLLNLKIMDLSHSEELMKIPDFSQMPNLEKLNLTGCIRLDEVPSSIGDLKHLTSLNLAYCKSLETIPSIQNLSKLGYLKMKNCKGISQFPSCAHMESLYYLSLENCYKITEFPQVPTGIKLLELGGTSIEDLPSSIDQFSQLITLDLTNCKMLRSLPTNISSLTLLQQLHLSGCSKLPTLPRGVFDMKFLRALTLTCLDPEGLPEELGNLEALERLIIYRSPIMKLPSSFSRLTRLGHLCFHECQGLILPDCSGLQALFSLMLIGCELTEIPQTLGTFLVLQELKIHDNNLVSINPSIKQLSRLEVLYARDCRALQSFPELPPRLECLQVCNCTSLEFMPTLLTQCPDDDDQGIGIRVANFGNCFNLSPHTRNKIMIEAQLLIQQCANYLLNQELDIEDSTEELEYIFIISEARFCIPGSELPDWFQYYSTGYSVTVQASSSAEVADFGRLAFGVVIACNGEYNADDFDIRCECHLKSHSGQYIECDSYYYTPDPVDLEHWDPTFLCSHHVFLWYNSFGLHIPQRYFTDAVFEFYAVDAKKERLLSCEVVGCGVSVMEVKCDIREMNDFT